MTQPEPHPLIDKCGAECCLEVLRLHVSDLVRHVRHDTGLS